MKFLVILALIVLCNICIVSGDRMIGEDYNKLASIQYANGNVSAPFNYNNSYADIMNASEEMSPKIKAGNYESTKYDIPVGPYKVSYELRSPLNYFGVDYYTHNESTGSGKDYHIAQYDVYSLKTGYIANVTYVDETMSFDGTGNSTTVKNAKDEVRSEITPEVLDISIMHYIGPMKYEASNPVDFISDNLLAVPSSWDTGYVGSNDISIDSKPGMEIYEEKQSKMGKVLAYHYNYVYKLNPETMIVIRTSGNWNYAKDLALFADTLHISNVGS